MMSSILISLMASCSGMRFTRTRFTTGSVTALSSAPTTAPTAPWDAAPITLLTTSDILLLYSTLLLLFE